MDEYNNKKRKFNGKLRLILGPMFSEKSTELLSRHRRYRIAGRKCFLIKYYKDDRYGNGDVIITHDGVKSDVEVYRCRHLGDADLNIGYYDVICIDEIQFFDDADIYCEKWANMGLIVEVSGLNGKYDRKPFEIISKLIPLADDITYKNAICKKTGELAPFTKRLIESKDDIIIGSNDIYEAVDRHTYFNHK